jgi:hypothetical protein
LVECDLAKVDVAGSNPVSRSRICASGADRKESNTPAMQSAPRLMVSLFLATAAALAQYKSEPAGPPPPDLTATIGQALQTPGTRILNASGAAFCEVWFRSEAPAAAKSSEADVTLPTIPTGALLGAIRFPGAGADRRGQSIKAGVYTLRYALQPVTGDHVGASPQRDFLVLIPAAEDLDLNATPAFDALMNMSRRASGTPHPAVLSIWSSTADKFPSFGKEGERDWVLNIKIGDLPLAIILAGKAE